MNALQALITVIVMQGVQTYKAVLHVPVVKDTQEMVLSVKVRSRQQLSEIRFKFDFKPPSFPPNEHLHIYITYITL